MARPFTGLIVLGIVCGPILASEPKFSAEQLKRYENDVKPLLREHCFKCHGADEKKVKAELRLTTRALILKGGESGPAANLDKPAQSLLLQAIKNQRADGGGVMPPAGQLPPEKIAILEKWITEKLPVTAADMGQAEATHTDVITDESRRFWAYQPLKIVEIPGDGKTHPVDAFIHVGLKAKGLAATGAATKPVLIRRAYYDLIGLPPTPAQIDAFVHDASPNAFEKVIDGLLASPHYGEKWGRHWLDVVRYAETNGYERDGPKPNAWRYRDYVIRSFNSDKPYSTFLREQLAGDEFKNPTIDSLAATGFYRLGIWDDEPADIEQSLYDGYDDIVTVVGQGVLGMSLNCARCHDHKKDPIRQSDYYRFLAFFRDIRPFSHHRGVDSPNNAVDITPPEKRTYHEADLAVRKKQIDALIAKMKPIEDAAIKTMSPADQLAVDDGHRAAIIRKVPSYLEPPVRAEYSKLRKDLAALENKPMPFQEFALGVNNCDPTPPPVYVLARGNPYSPKEKELCIPGYPAVLSVPDPAITPTAKSTGRRTALAEWITHDTNALTARVIVNRVWQWHFGRGIVGSPNDFGKLGELPTHPELLDWLAAEFVEGGWQLKRMHKLIMLSSAYRLSSAANEANLKSDPANDLLWRFNARRLSGEEVRDSVLSVSGALNLKQFGPSTYPKIPKEVLAGQSVPGQGWPTSPAEEGNRRSVYAHVKRSLRVPILVGFDQPDPDSSCPVRYVTTVPTQALGLLNGEFANEQAELFAKRLQKDAPNDASAQVARAILLTTGRAPHADEVKADVAFIERLKAKHKLSDFKALAQFALLCLNANEFVYLD
jgi:hypothetical protein